MSAIQSEDRVETRAHSLETWWKPGHINEICMVDREYKVRFIQRLREVYTHHHYISDIAFRTLKEIQNSVDALAVPIELLILDISEILYLDFIKDAEMLQENIKILYASLGRLCKQGVTCIVFVNYCYYFIPQRAEGPPLVQVLIVPSQAFPSWDKGMPGLAGGRLFLHQ